MWSCYRKGWSWLGVALLASGLLATAAANAAEKKEKGAKEPAPLPGCEAEVKAGKEKGKQDRFFPMPRAKV